MKERLQDGRWAADGGGLDELSEGCVLKWSWQDHLRWGDGNREFSFALLSFWKEILVSCESQISKLLSKGKITWVAHGQGFVMGFACLLGLVNMLATAIQTAKQKMSQVNGISWVSVKTRPTPASHTPSANWIQFTKSQKLALNCISHY